MSSIECSTTLEIANHSADIVDILESISSVPVKTHAQDLTVLIKPEDKLYEIPMSTIEISSQGNKYVIKHKGRLQRRDGSIQARAICISTASDNPKAFFMAAGFEISEEKKREFMIGTYDNITLYGYFGSIPYIELSLICQQAEVEESIEKLKELIRLIN